MLNKTAASVLGVGARKVIHLKWAGLIPWPVPNALSDPPLASARLVLAFQLLDASFFAVQR